MNSRELQWPSRLFQRARAMYANELSTVLRHDVRNKLTAIRSCAYYLRRKVEKNSQLLTDDPRSAQFFDLIAQELAAASEMLATPPLPEEQKVRVDAVQVAAALWDAAGRQTLIPFAHTGSFVFEACVEELEVLLLGLLESALELGVRGVHLTGNGSMLTLRAEGASSADPPPLWFRAARQFAGKLNGSFDADPIEGGLLMTFRLKASS